MSASAKNPVAPLQSSLSLSLGRVSPASGDNLAPPPVPSPAQQARLAHYCTIPAQTQAPKGGATSTVLHTHCVSSKTNTLRPAKNGPNCTRTQSDTLQPPLSSVRTRTVESTYRPTKEKPPTPLPQTLGFVATRGLGHRLGKGASVTKELAEDAHAVS